MRPRLLVAAFDDLPPCDTDTKDVLSAAAIAHAALDAIGPEDYDLDIDLLELPRSYDEANQAVIEHMTASPPTIVLLLDTDPTSGDHRLEVFAANYADDAEPDTTGKVLQDQILDAEGPVAYRSKLPLDGIWDKFVVERVPLRMSHKAGLHVFNATYYRLMRHIAETGAHIIAGAARLPGHREEDGAPRPVLTEELAEEVVMIVAVLRQLWANVTSDPEQA